MRLARVRPPAGRARSARSIHGLFVVRLLLIANGVVLSVIATLYALFGGRPGGLVVAALVGGLAVALFACLPLTNIDRRR